jgi:protein-disulfide isomerase
LTLSIRLALAGAALVALSACSDDKASTNGTTASNVTATPVAAPNNGDWSTVVSETPQGGFVMGNPDAPVKVVEYASLTCPHCAAFSAEGYRPLTEEYVKRGLVSFELRNFVLNGLDLGASVLSRCNGAEPYFALTERFFANQDAMMQAAQNADPAQLQAIQSLPQSQQMTRFAELTGLIGFVGGLGVPEPRARECLADPSAVATLERIRNEGVEQHNIPGTPTFLINGEVVPNVTGWSMLKAQIDAALP